jgi:hypothetical protein
VTDEGDVPPGRRGRRARRSWPKPRGDLQLMVTRARRALPSTPPLTPARPARSRTERRRRGSPPPSAVAAAASASHGRTHLAQGLPPEHFLCTPVPRTAASQTRSFSVGEGGWAGLAAGSGHAENGHAETAVVGCWWQIWADPVLQRYFACAIVGVPSAPSRVKTRTPSRSRTASDRPGSRWPFGACRVDLAHSPVGQVGPASHVAASLSADCPAG